MASPLLPLTEKPLTRADAALLLRGLAEFIESYPAEGFIVTLDIQPALHENPSRPRTKKKG